VSMIGKYGDTLRNASQYSRLVWLAGLLLVLPTVAHSQRSAHRARPLDGSSPPNGILERRSGSSLDLCLLCDPSDCPQLFGEYFYSIKRTRRPSGDRFDQKMESFLRLSKGRRCTASRAVKYSS